MIVTLASKDLRGAAPLHTLGEQSVVAALTMPVWAIYMLVVIALCLYGLAQGLGFFRWPARRRAAEKLWLATSSLFWFAAGGNLLAIVLHGAIEQSAQITLSSPYPEIGILILGSAVLWLGYAIYRLWHRSTQ